MQIDDLGEIGALDEQLLPWTELCDQGRLGLIQMKQIAGPLEIHPGVGKKHLRGAALDDRPQQGGIGKVIAALRGQDERGVPLPPGLESLRDVRLDRGVTRESTTTDFSTGMRHAYGER